MDVVKELSLKWRQKWPGLVGLNCAEWTPWENRNDLNIVNNVGVYVLAKYEAGKVPDIVNPIDEKIIYIGRTNIGETTSLKKRITDFHREAFGNGAKHSGASTYKSHFGKVQDELYLTVCPIYWSDENINELINNKNNFKAWINGTSPWPEPFYIHLMVNWLEVCLRGLYVFEWGRLPICNKE